MSPHSLVEISFCDLDEEAALSVFCLFDRWGRGGAVVEHFPGEPAVSIVKAYLLSEDDDRLRQIEIGLELLSRARRGVADQDQVSARPIPAPNLRFLAEADWAEAWKANYDVQRIGRRLVIQPTWREHVLGPDDLVISLDPGLAFGSGLHPTTRLCLAALEDYLHPGASVLDLGTGSGILAIAAARLGASRVLALDSDPLAVRVAGENIRLNQVESLVQVKVGTLPIPGLTYQKPNLVVANILAETIVELAPALAASLAAPGILIASGIIQERATAVVAALGEYGLSLAERRDDGEWVALITRKGTL